MKIAEIAKQLNVSSQAIYKIIKNHKEEFEAYSALDKKSKELNEDEVAAVYKYSNASRPAVLNQRLADENEQMKKQLDEQRQHIDELQRQITQLQNDKLALGETLLSTKASQLQLELEAKSLKEKAEAYDQARKSFLGRLFIK